MVGFYLFSVTACVFILLSTANYVIITVFLPGLKGGKVLIWEKGTFVRGLSF